MTNRKKRLKKSIESIKKQILLHKEKREKAKEEGNIENCVNIVTFILQLSICITARNYHINNAVIHIERVGYYDKELEGLIEQAKEKEEQLET